MKKGIITVVIVIAIVGFWGLSSYPRGVIRANLDFRMGHERILVTGMPDLFSPPGRDDLEKTYGIEFKQFAEIPSPRQRAYSEGYNSTMQGLLQKKHGKDVFADAERVDVHK